LRPQYSILVGNAIISAVQSGTLGDNSALQTVESAYVAPGLSVAAALHPSFGLMGEARYVWTRLEAGSDVANVRQGIQLSGLADFDMDPLWRLPVAVAALVHLETRLDHDGINRVLDVGGGIYYTRRVNLQLGLELVRRSGELRREPLPSLNLSMGIATIALRYHW
jgi:hypothetical protein